MSTLSITFTSNYAGGAYIIYYKLSTAVSYTSVPFTCSTTVPSPCTVNIPIPTLSNDSCDAITYEGYIEPACCGGNPVCQETFTVTFTPTELCKAVEFTCNNVPNCNNTDTGSSSPCIDDTSSIVEKPFGERFTLCYPGGAAGVPAGNFAQYTYADDPSTCCYDCVSILATGAGGFQYVDCTTSAIVTTNVASSPTFCARKDSYSRNVGSTAVFTVTSPTCP